MAGYKLDPFRKIVAVNFGCRTTITVAAGTGTGQDLVYLNVPYFNAAPPPYGHSGWFDASASGILTGTAIVFDPNVSINALGIRADGLMELNLVCYDGIVHGDGSFMTDLVLTIDHTDYRADDTEVILDNGHNTQTSYLWADPFDFELDTEYCIKIRRD